MDKHSIALMQRTAESFQKLAVLRGINCTVTVSDKGQYCVNGKPVGVSVHQLQA